jgi:hypothetical protein
VVVDVSEGYICSSFGFQGKVGETFLRIGDTCLDDLNAVHNSEGRNFLYLHVSSLTFYAVKIPLIMNISMPWCHGSVTRLSSIFLEKVMAFSNGVSGLGSLTL